MEKSYQPVTHDALMASLPADQQARIARRAAEMVAEIETLKEMRRARRRSQAKVAKELKINQAAVSKLERRTDMYVSTLRSYIEAMGGELEIIARFPGSPPYHIQQFHDLH